MEIERTRTALKSVFIDLIFAVLIYPTMLAKETVEFLKKLEKNNDRDWFNANKADFVKANDNVIAVTGDLLSRISKFDPES